MATGVKPREDDPQLTRTDLEAIQEAMKQKKFRDLLADYCEEVRDPANQALYQKEMVQLEKERGYDVTFINPKGSYVIKTSVAGDRKAFINICSNENVDKPSYRVQEVDGKRGMNWLLPYTLTPPREDFNNKRERCIVYDVVFNPDTLRMAAVNKQFREMVNKTAFDGLQKAYDIHLDSNNPRFPKSYYKGMTTPAVIRKEDPNYKPPTHEEEEGEEMSAEMLEKLYPQKIYRAHADETKKQDNDATQCKRKNLRANNEFIHKTDDHYTIPKYVIKQQQNVDLQDFTFHKDSKQHSAIPSQIVVEINLPLLSSTSDCSLDVQEKNLNLISEKPAKYKLNIPLPYSVNDECGNAKFDKSQRKLIVTLPVIRKYYDSENNFIKVDSGVESEENSGSQSEEEGEQPKNMVVELSSSINIEPTPTTDNTKVETQDSFFDSSLSYLLPAYTCNVMDDIVAFTFHVKNTEPDSVQVKNEGNRISLKFTSVGAGFVPVHYAAMIVFDDNVAFENATGEAWDNNVILQLEVSGQIPLKFNIGLNDVMTCEYLDASQVKTTSKKDAKVEDLDEDDIAPMVEVTNLATETNIVLSSNHDEEEDEDDDDDDSLDSPTSLDKDIVFTESNTENGAKSILRKPMHMMRSYSESSAGDVASSMDYISSDCIPEESSLKKTVRFNDVISKQFYRYNSSIEGQKKKNQRKKSKKRNLERRKSESEAEDEATNSTQISKQKLKSVLKQRRDSGLADTSDAEGECKNSPDDSSFNENNSMLNIVGKDKPSEDSEPDIWETKTEKTQKNPDKTITSENIQHNTNLYDPDRLNKGQYLEVAFKNDLIFDLDM